jgi:hypothetical protein
LAYQSEGSQKDAGDHWAPVFIIYGHCRSYNRIGRPSVKLDEKGKEKIFINAEDPVVYFMKRSFRTDKAAYTNLIYRVHFSKTPYSLIPSASTIPMVCSKGMSKGRSSRWKLCS